MHKALVEAERVDIHQVDADLYCVTVSLTSETKFVSEPKDLMTAGYIPNSDSTITEWQNKLVFREVKNTEEQIPKTTFFNC